MRLDWVGEERICPVCGKTFTQNSPNHMCCCRTCREKYTKIRKAEKEERESGTFIPPNMKRIMDLVKDDPDYGRIVARKEMAYKG